MGLQTSVRTVTANSRTRTRPASSQRGPILGPDGGRATLGLRRPSGSSAGLHVRDCVNIGAAGARSQPRRNPSPLTSEDPNSRGEIDRRVRPRRPIPCTRESIVRSPLSPASVIIAPCAPYRQADAAPPIVAEGTNGFEIRRRRPGRQLRAPFHYFGRALPGHDVTLALQDVPSSRAEPTSAELPLQRRPRPPARARR